MVAAMLYNNEKYSNTSASKDLLLFQMKKTKRSQLYNVSAAVESTPVDQQVGNLDFK